MSTQGIASSDRVDFWREQTAQIAFPLTLRDWAEDQQFIIRPLGAVAMIDMACQLTERSHSDIIKKSGDCVVIARQCSGETLLEGRNGREPVLLKAGDVAAVDPDQPFIHASNQGVLRVWVFPRAVLPHVPTLLDQCGGIMRLRDDGAEKIAKTFIDELGLQIDKLGPSEAEAFGVEAAQIISIALSARMKREPGEAARNVPSSARLLHLKNAIDRQLSDPLLSATRIAAECGISARTVHYVFEFERGEFCELCFGAKARDGKGCPLQSAKCLHLDCRTRFCLRV